MNKADPDCGTSFSWVTKAMGPQLGWMAGWAIIVADVIVMANLAPDRRPLHLRALRPRHGCAESTLAVTTVGVDLDRRSMTAIVVIGIELSARTQVGLLAAEIFTLALFSVVALVKVYSRARRGRTRSTRASPGSTPSPLSPLGDLRRDAPRPSSSTGAGTRRRRVNEETEDPRRGAGQGDGDQHLDPARRSTSSSRSPPSPTTGSKASSTEPEDVLSRLGTEVFGSPLDKLLIIAVLTSAAASTQTTILPTARTTLSMARPTRCPRSLGKVHPRFLTPHISTIADGRRSRSSGTSG